MSSLTGPLDHGRRNALKAMASALAAGLAGCSEAPPDILHYVDQPETLLPGIPKAFATTLPLSGYGRGVIVTSNEGRPTKVSGNPAHPASLGGTDVFAEAEILSLYDPDRSSSVLRGGDMAAWEALETALEEALERLGRRNGEGLAILTGRITSPTTLRLLALAKSRFSKLMWSRYEPLHDDAAREGSRLAFGRVLDMLPLLDRVDTLVALDADPLGPGPLQLAEARAFASRRTLRGSAGSMMRLYAFEPTLTLTGAMADHRLALSPSVLNKAALQLAAALDLPGIAADADMPAPVKAAADDLRRSGRRGLVLAGGAAPPEIHALALAINAHLGSLGEAVRLIDPVDPHPEDHGDSIKALADNLAAGNVDTLLVLDANPAHAAPDDLRLRELIPRARLSVHLGILRDETADVCGWHAPLAHPLESWGDLRAADGTASLVQPLTLPLHGGRTVDDVLALIAGEDGTALDRVRRTWMEQHQGDEFEPFWHEALRSGVIAGSAAPSVPPPPLAPSPVTARPRPATEGLTLIVRPDPTVWDGRYANNAWLQECPKPVSREVWGASLAMAPSDAAGHGLADGDEVAIEVGSRTLLAAARIDAGLAEGVTAITLGYGRTRSGQIGSGLGSNAYLLRTSREAWQVQGLRLEKTGERRPIHRVQLTLDEGGETVAPELSLVALAGGARLGSGDGYPSTLYPSYPYEQPASQGGEPYRWAMVIDTTLCIGCNACVLACQAENNVPVVGPEEIDRGRMMHWLRIDTYETGRGNDPRPVFQPVPCMHCEQAPCEPVCPVEASVHDHDGLNVQVYNRCVGTRFCQANCPYKVRRFNFFGYADGQEFANLGQSPAEARYNPDVSVRARGVMEKCTYCVQRISGARRRAENEGRVIREGEVETACASACPTRAIRFGNLNAPGAEVAALRSENRHYSLLGHLGTRPRTTYLARIRNARPDLEESYL